MEGESEDRVVLQEMMEVVLEKLEYLDTCLRRYQKAKVMDKSKRCDRFYLGYSLFLLMQFFNEENLYE